MLVCEIHFWYTNVKKLIERVSLTMGIRKGFVFKTFTMTTTK